MAFPVEAAIGAVATVLVGLLGYRQWKRTKRSGSFIQDREAAYKSIWEALEEVHIYVRGQRYQQDEFDRLVREANTRLIRHALHIDESDRMLAAAYMDALAGVGRVLAEMSESEFAHGMALTAEGMAAPQGYAAAFRAYEDARGAVIRSFRQAIGAGQI